MFTFGGWAAANLLGGGIGFALASDPRARTFWEFTLMWNAVNLGLAVAALIATWNDEPSTLDLKASLSQGDTYEKLFLFNGGLDVAYLVAAGVLLEHGARTGEVRWTGYGNSLLVQASFLLVFDLAMFVLHRNIDHSILDRLRVSPSGLGLSF